jgi:hypothetical protein
LPGLTAPAYFHPTVEENFAHKSADISIFRHPIISYDPMNEFIEEGMVGEKIYTSKELGNESQRTG